MQQTSEFSFRKIMAIEDSAIDQYVLGQMVKRSSFAEEVFMSSSAQEALTRLDKLTSNNEDMPELIFLDIHMPNMNGFAFLTELERKYGHIKDSMSVIILTTSLDPIDRTTSNSYSNIKMFLNKPLTIDKLNFVSSQFASAD